MLDVAIVTKYEAILKNRGELGLYQKIVGSTIVRSVDVVQPDVELLNLSESFFSEFRKSGDNKYFIIGKILRRSAHTIYRQLLKLNKTPINSKFLNMVR